MELFRALGALAEEAGAEQARIGRVLELPGGPDPADHTELFVLQLPPYASIYMGAEGMLGGEARDRVAGFWRALGQVPPAEPDHLTLLLSLYATLVEKETDAADGDRAGAWRRARQALLWEHLLSWVPPYLDRIEEVAPPFYRAWAGLLRRALVEEAAELGASDRVSLHLRDAPPPLSVERDAELDDLLTALLAPVRSGAILIKADLARLGKETGLGVRMGERRFILKTMIQQDAEAVLGWLGEELGRHAVRHRQAPQPLDAVAGFWAGRAEASAAVLDALRSEAAAAAALQEQALSSA